MSGPVCGDKVEVIAIRIDDVATLGGERKCDSALDLWKSRRKSVQQERWKEVGEQHDRASDCGCPLVYIRTLDFGTNIYTSQVYYALYWTSHTGTTDTTASSLPFPQT